MKSWTEEIGGESNLTFTAGWFCNSNSKFWTIRSKSTLKKEAQQKNSFNQYISSLVLGHHCQEIKIKMVLYPYIHCSKEKRSCSEDYNNWGCKRICMYVFCSWCIDPPHSMPSSKLSYIFNLHRKLLEKEKMFNQSYYNLIGVNKGPIYLNFFVKLSAYIFNE